MADASAVATSDNVSLLQVRGLENKFISWSHLKILSRVHVFILLILSSLITEISELSNF